MKIEDTNADRWASQAAMKFLPQILGRSKDEIAREWKLVEAAFKRDSQ
jgi:hypothetical protein